MGAQVPGADRAILHIAVILSSLFPGETQGGISSLGTHTGSRMTLTLQPTQKPLVTIQQPKRKCNFPLQTTDPLGFSLQASQLFKVNEAHIKGQPVAHQEIKPLSGENGRSRASLLPLTPRALIQMASFNHIWDTQSSQAWPSLNPESWDTHAEGSISETPSRHLRSTVVPQLKDSSFARRWHHHVLVL